VAHRHVAGIGMPAALDCQTTGDKSSSCQCGVHVCCCLACRCAQVWCGWFIGRHGSVQHTCTYVTPPNRQTAKPPKQLH
jgi:hypothetical protein